MQDDTDRKRGGTDAPGLLDIGAVARLLHCSARHVMRLADAGRMPAPVRLGSLVRWTRSGPNGIDAWIAGGCRPLSAAAKGGK